MRVLFNLFFGIFLFALLIEQISELKKDSENEKV